MTEGLQPFLSDAVVALRAPTQVWSDRTGELGTASIHGVFHGDTRFIRSASLTYGTDAADLAPEWVSTSIVSASEVRFDALLRGVDDVTPDPKVRLTRTRVVTDGTVTETLRLASALPTPVPVVLSLRLQPDATPLQEVKAGATAAASVSVTRDGDDVVTMAHGASMRLTARGAEVTVPPSTSCPPDERTRSARAERVSSAREHDVDEVALTWRLEVRARGEVSATWSATLDDPSLVVRGTDRDAGWTVPQADDPRLRRWLELALDDLDALRLRLPDASDEFFAAGAPWFFTLFGRDSLWAARLFLPVDAGMAASTLRVLARLQGTRTDPATAEQPGKIAHELRAGTLTMPGEAITLPPLYYGTVDATPLWVTLLAEAHAHGMPEHEVRQLLPALRAALEWIRDAANADGFLDYVDETGHGLSNQGWKDSGDSIQWRTGALADGPIALSEVQGYAYEAMVSAADLLDALGESGGAELRGRAAELRERFRARFWVTTPEGRYPAIALDRHGEPVDTLTSNIGHLLGTGILDPDEEQAVAALLVGPSMASGFGLRTMSTDAAGFWPLSYHGGSVWAHDTAIVARGMATAGLQREAETLVDGMLAAAEAFGYRMPELHAGDDASSHTVPAPYPAACRPQAWSAAAAVVCAEILSIGR